jgi:SsrA-binding protein
MTNTKSIAKNKKAFFDYEILDQFEAGIKLLGSEVKSCRAGNLNLKASYISILNNKAFVKNLHISQFKFSQDKNYDPLRERELLLNAKELHKIQNELNTQGVTVVPLEIYLKNNLFKLRIGVCRGKKSYDKRESLKRKAQGRDIAQRLKSLR